MGTGCNWRSTLSDYAAMSGVLAGFCIAFIALILGGQVANIQIYTFGTTFGQITVLFFGTSSGLFVCAAEFLLRAKEFDAFGVVDSYLDLWKRDCERKNKKWEDFRDEQTKHCRDNEKRGRICYNIAIFMMFISLFFVIFPYSIVIATIVGGLGVFLELLQMAKYRSG